MLAALRDRLTELEQRTRPVPPDLQAALERRWEELPAHVKTPSQALGRRTNGCEGTHGVFPRCNLACTPCYHGKDANRVRTDGEHTRSEIDAQMALLNQRRGPGQYAQLIGGEVTLLGPEEHARALEAMQAHRRKPMSMTHGDFDYPYLEQLALHPDGTPRFRSLSFAGHFDSLMYGRRGIKRVHDERELHPHRQAFCDMFARLEREHGVKSYLAHNMTVTPRNIGQVADVVRESRDMGFRMFSFQPAAYVGNTNRWKGGDFRSFSTDEVWRQVESGVGARLVYKTFQIGDERCNRTAYGTYVGDRYLPLLDDHDPADLVVRDAFFQTFGGMDFDVAPKELAAKLARSFAGNPRAVGLAARWAARFARRAGVRSLLREEVRPITYVMHAFMDARLVKPAWEGLKRGEMSDDAEVRATQERLQACSYAMSHPESDELVPACAQHSILDPLENLHLQELLPLAVEPAEPVTA